MNKDLPHGMGNYLQYTVITHKEKESERLCITEALCCTPETQHSKSTIRQLKKV